MPYVQVSNLDFNQIKTALKDYLKSESDFTGYDFEGSVWSTLLDVLAYNTYYTAFNTNMVVNELFLDSATLRDNVVAIAKQLGYTPKSAVAPKANVTCQINFTGTYPNTITLKKGTGFTTVFDSDLYEYVVVDDITTSVVNGVATFTNLPIYEGTIVKNYYTINTSLKSQRFIIQNVGLDVSSIRVKVFDSISSTTFKTFEYSNNILDVNSNSNVFFVEEIEDENYEIFFGDGVIGKKLENGNYIEITYLITNASATNGAKQFTFAGVLQDINGVTNYPFTIASVTTSSIASGGEEVESISKIKFNASKYFGTQDRAVTAQDYAAIVRNIYPAISDIITYGGENEVPPEYGKVKIVVKPKNTASLSALTKNEIAQKLKSYMVGSVIPEIVDPSILYIEIISNISFSKSRTTLSAEEVKNKVITSIEKYLAQSDVEKFNGKFRLSKIIGSIDSADQSINSNDTTVIMRKDFYPTLNSKFYYEICYQNEFDSDCEQSVVQSTGFVVSEYPSYTSYVEDRSGVLVLYRLDSLTGEKIVLNDSLGKVDYVKGEIMMYNLTIIKGSFDDNRIELRVRPKHGDINVLREAYIDVDIAQSKFTTYSE
jgi:hypothetical protein